jgi:2-polyprenyl-6-methoxyphenol hydroxylase-like FAD-dependent oxidoreductase
VQFPGLHKLLLSPFMLTGRGSSHQWGKSFKTFDSHNDSVTAHFEDGSAVEGRLLVGCDGTRSRVRRALFPDQHTTHQIPVRVMGVTVEYAPEQMDPLQKLDALFLQGTAAENDSYAFFGGKPKPPRAPPCPPAIFRC